MTLTPKQEAFAKAYVETGNGSEAYRRAYDVENMKPSTVNRKAVELLENGKITARLDQLQQRAQKRHDITIDTLTEMLKADRELARELEQSSAAVSAVMGLAKIHGLILDKAQISGDENNPIVTRVELVAPEYGHSSH
jgi:phage terminase small subunit